MPKARSGYLWLLLSVLALPADVLAQGAHFNYAQEVLSNGFSAPAGEAADGNGNLYVADTGNNAVKKVPAGCNNPTCTVTVGSGFSGPSGIALDASGDVFVADTNNHAVKEMVAVNGAIPASPTINTLGSGFSAPVAVAVDDGGNVYVADRGNASVKEILAAGGYTTVNSLGSGFKSPSGVAVDNSGDVFVTDATNNVVQEIQAVNGSVPANATVTTVAGGFSEPAGVAVDGSGDVFVADSGNALVKELVAVNGSIPALPTITSFGTGLGTPTDVTLGANGTIYTADTRKNSAVVLDTQAVDFGTVSILSEAGIYSLVFTFTSGGAIGAPATVSTGAIVYDYAAVPTGTTCKAGTFNAGAMCVLNVLFSPQLAGERNGAAILYDTSTPANALATVYLTGTGMGSLAAFPPGTISSIAGAGTAGYNNDNIAATGAELDNPGGVAFDGAGNIYIADAGNDRVRMVNATAGTLPAGTITTVAGGGSGCGGQTDPVGDGCSAKNALLSNPAAVALDGAGNLYIADSGNQRIRVVNATTATITTVAGGGSGCAAQTDSLGDGCAAANSKLSSPTSIAVDGAGNLYIADTQNNAVREVNAATGVISELAALSTPAGLALDNAGDVYVAESSSALVQKINLLTGDVTTVAGGGIGCAAETDSAGDGCPATNAKLTNPVGVALDEAGNVYIADEAGEALRVVNASTGLISTGAGGGTGCAGQSDTVGDGCAATSAAISPSSVAIDTKGNIYAADSTGERVRQIDWADPTPLVFPNTNVAADSPTMYETAESIGQSSLSLGGFTLYGGDGNNFGIDENTTTCAVNTRLLTAGETCVVGLIFAPRSTGPVSTQVAFDDNAPGGGQNIPVSGTGLPEVTPPAPTITSSPSNPTTATFATFAFTDQQLGVSYVCSLNGGTYTACTSPMTYTGLEVNSIESFYVEAVDSLGTASTAASYSWQVVTPPPLPTFTNGPASTTTLTTAFITFKDAQVGVTFLCSQDGAAFVPCGSPVSLSGLAVGAHTFAVEAQQSPLIVSGISTLLWTITPPPPPTPIATPGSSAAVNFGTIPVGQTSAKSTITFTFSLGGSVATINALTQGAKNQDFAALSSGTCQAGQSYGTGGSCTVDVTFWPKFAGTRYGAVVLEDAYGNTISTGYVQGTGTGPQLSYSPYSQTSLGGGFGTPNSVAADGLGNIYVADITDAVKVIPPGCTSGSCVTTLGAGFLGVTAVAVDGAGNVFVVEADTGSVFEIAPGCISENCVKTLSSSLITPVSIAVDGGGNVFIADDGPQSAGNGTGTSYSNGSIKELLASSGYATVKTLSSGISYLNSIAVDSASNVFFVTGNLPSNSNVEEIPAAGGYANTNVLLSGLYGPQSIEVDGENNLYIVDGGDGVLRKVLASSNYSSGATVITYGGSIPVPTGIGLDASGNIYAAVPTAMVGGVFKLDYADPPALAFATTSDGSTDTVDRTETVVVENSGNATLNLTTVAPPAANFSLVGAATTCTNSSTVAAGSFCTIGVQFSPTASGKLSDAVTLTDNNLNVSGATQSISLSGTGETGGPPPAPTITSSPPNPSGTPTAAFAFTDSQAGVTFECSLDGAAYAVCVSGVSFPNLANGAHTFGVRAADALENLSAVSSYGWTVTALPVPVIDEAPASPTTATTATFTFSDALAGGSFVCSLDGAAYMACTSGVSYSSLSTAAHTFAVEYENGSGVLSAPATWTWTVATTLTVQPGMAQDFGTIPIGQASGTVPLTFTLPASATLGAPVALTEGAPNLDFAITGGSCASGASFASGATCTVNVMFTPQATGLRRGAVVLESNSGGALASLYIQGIGSGPQIRLLSGYTFAPSAETALGGGFSDPKGVAVDGAGNVYVADNGNNAVKKIPFGCASASCVVTLGTNMNSPFAITVDGGGNVYVGEVDPSQVVEIPYGCTSSACFVSLGGGFYGPEGVAVDAAGNVFVADYANNAVEEMPPGCASTTCVKPLGSGLIGPEGVTVDANDNVYLVQYGLNSSDESGNSGCSDFVCVSNTVALLEIPAADGYSTVKTLAAAFNSPLSLAMDGNGNAYITEWSANLGEVQVWSASSDYTAMDPININCGATVAGSFCDRAGVAVDGGGDIYVADSDNNSIMEMTFSKPQALAFATPTIAGTVDATDISEGIWILNYGNAPLDLSSVAATAGFTAFGAGDPCPITAALAPGAICSVAVLFTPASSGPISGTLTLTDNNLNVANATQQVPLTGTGLPPGPTITGAPANGNESGSATFTFSDTDTAVISYLCSLDNAAFSACTSGITYSSVAAGLHNFSVEAKNSSGSVSAATTYQWLEIAVTLPTPVITSMPSNPTTSTTAIFTFTDAEPGVQYTCLLINLTSFSVSGGACVSGVSYTTVVNDTFEFSVTAGDSYGNTSAGVTYEWGVVATPPPPPGPPPPPLTSGNFGTEPIGQTTAPITLTLSFPNYGTGTIGSIAALTMGVPNLDFNLASGGTCAAGTTYTSSTTCTVNVTFTPTLSGWRRGGVAVRDTSGNVLSEAYIQGIGTGPQVNFLPGIESTLITGFTQPLYPTVDGFGNFYVYDYVIGGTSALYEFPVGCTQKSCSRTEPIDSGGIAFDGLGNLIVSGTSGGGVYVDPPGCNANTCMYQLGNGLLQGPQSNFVDGAGNLYAADVYQYFGLDELLASEGYSKLHTWGGYDIGGARQVAVDPNGNMFVAASFGGSWEIPAGCAQYSCMIDPFPFVATTTNAQDSFTYGGILDGVGNAFFDSDLLYESYVGTNYSPSTYGTIFNLDSTSPSDTYVSSGGLGIDPVGNVYFAATYSSNSTMQVGGALYKIDFNTPPTLTFATATAVGSTDTTDGTLTATINNNGNGPLTFASIATSNPSFVIDASATTCSTATQLAAQTNCKVGVKFTPTTPGAITAALVVTDNSLNAPGSATQLIPLVATATGSSSLTATTTTLKSSAASASAGTSITLTATVTPNTGSVTPTGIVTFMDGGLVLGTGAANGSGVATLTITKLAVGSHSIVASYGGDSKNASSASTAVSVNVTPATVATTTVLNASASALAAGSTLSLLAEVLPASGSGTPTGTVTFLDGATSIGTATLNADEQATLTTTSLAAGVHSLTVVYGGDSDDTGSTSAPVSVTIEAIVATSTALSANPNPVATGNFITFTAKVTPASGTNTPTGVVTFMNGTTSLGAVVLNSGAASLMVNSLAAGAYSITAQYGGDTENNPSTSAAVNVNVSTSVSGTTTQLASSSSSVAAGGSATLTASVSPVTGNGIPTGAVTFLDGATPLCTGALSAKAVATCTPIFATTGAHSISASYGGDSSDLSSTSATLTITVGADPTTTTILANASSIPAFNSVLLEANVKANVGSGVPTGTVTFMDGATNLGSGTLSAGGSASITTTALDVEIHNITADYGGDSKNLASNSGALAISVGELSTATALKASAATANLGSSVTFTASVLPSSGSATPTGSVTFIDGSNTLGSVTLNNGAATLSTSSLGSGLHSVVANYGGDKNDEASTSGTVQVSISATSVATSTTLQASANSPTYGNSVTFTATVTPSSGSGVPTGTVAFMDGASLLGKSAVNGSGVAMYATSFLAVGAHSITAMYGGDSGNNASTSGAVSVNVAAAPAAVVSLAPALLTFTAANGAISGAQTATLMNTGNAALTINSIGVLGANPGAFKETTTCGGTLAAGASCAISITFAPASVAGFAATLSVSDNATGSPHTVSLSGTGTVPESAAAAIGPASLMFTANAGTTSAAQMATLMNSGNAPLTIGGISISGTSAGSFNQSATTCGATLAANSSCTISVTFTPAAAGSYSASLNVTDNATGSPQAVALTGMGDAPVASLTPPLLMFTANAGTTSAAQMATLMNTGDAPLTINGISISGTNAGSFNQSASTCGATLAAGSSCTISVTFTPSAGGSFTATLNVADNATGSPQAVTLTGTGLAPVVSLTPASLMFSATTGTTSAAQTATLMNAGDAPLTFSISITGTNAIDFAQTSTCESPLAAGSSCTVSVTFTPAAAGSLTASLSVADNASGSPHTVALTGAGTLPPSFTLTAGPTSGNALQSSPVTVTLTVTPQNGAFTSQVGFTASGVPSGYTATFSPAKVTPGPSAATSTMTIQGGVATAHNGVWLKTAPLFAIVGLLFLPVRRRRRLLTLVVLAVASCGTLVVASCGGGFQLPTQNYSVTVTATGGGVTQNATVQLTVQQ